MLKKFFCIVLVICFLPIVFAIDTNDSNRVFSANIRLEKIFSQTITPDTNEIVVLPSDSGKYSWHIKDNQSFYSERFFSGQEFSTRFLFDLGSKKLVLYDDNAPIPSNVLPLLKANENSNLVFDISQTTETSKLFLLIVHSDGSKTETEKLHGEESFALASGDVVYFLFDSDDYGLNSFNANFSERFLSLKILVSQKMPLEEYYLELPKKDECEHWMDANESAFYCGFVHEFCASKAKDIGCSIEEIITCRTQECLDRLVNEGKIEKSELQLQLEDLKKSTIPEVRARVDVLASTVEDLNNAVTSTSQETQDVFNWGFTFTLALILFVVLGSVSWYFIDKYQLRKAGVTKNNELDFLETTKFEEEVLENGIQKENRKPEPSREPEPNKSNESKSSSNDWY